MSQRPRRFFSRRHGYSPSEQEITIREDAPEEFRATLLYMAEEASIRPSTLRDVMCRVLRKLPDPGNWSEYPNIWDEVQYLLQQCDWFRVYDITEAIYAHLAQHYPEQADTFEAAINDYFQEAGIGWQLMSGMIQTRGPEAFESSVHNATEVLDAVALPTASREIHEALRDLSRRPDPDRTGAIQHAMAALECVARDSCGDSKLTLGDIVKRYPQIFPKPLDDVVSKAWGYASEMGRHLREGRLPDRVEVELIVGLASTVATYLARKTKGM
jgi:AbiJ N-terminal domain 4